MDQLKQIPVFLLAGGLGTRLSEETHIKPKPMVEVGEIPVLIHIMRWYYKFGFDDFVICAGYKAWEIKQYFLDYEFRRNHLMIDHRKNPDARPSSIGENSAQEKWRVRVIDTGLETMTGARIARAMDEIKKTDSFTDFAVTYGDGISDVDLGAEHRFHSSHGKLGTVLGVHPIARFGELDVGQGNLVEGFLEKPQSRQGLINGGFFFFKSEFRKYLKIEPSCVLEGEPLVTLAKDSQLMMHPHAGFWQPMDTQRDKNYLQRIWETGTAPWNTENE